jgi:hypothetical protein
VKLSRFLAWLAFGSDEQTIATIKEQETDMATAEVCRRHGISSATFYKWKAKHGGLEIGPADEGPDLSFWPDTKPRQVHQRKEIFLNELCTICVLQSGFHNLDQWQMSYCH